MSGKHLPILCVLGLLAIHAPSTAQIVSVHNRVSTTVGLELVDPTIAGSFNGITVRYGDAPSTNGFGLLGVTSGGVNVADSSGLNFAPVAASAFNVIAAAPEALRDVEPVAPHEARAYLERLGAVQAIRFRRPGETPQDTPIRHLGLDLGTLPPELIAPGAEVPGSPEPGPGNAIKLMDWLALLTVSLQEAERRIESLEAELLALRGGPVGTVPLPSSSSPK